MNWARILRLAFSLALALLAVGLGGLSVQRKIQAFQPLGFEAASRAGAFSVTADEHPGTGLEPGDQTLLVNGGAVSTRSQLVQPLEERPDSELLVQRGEQVLQVRYHRQALQFD